MKLYLHQTHHIVGDFEKITAYLKGQISQQKDGLHLLPELFLSGYPLQDLCLQRIFAASYQDNLAKINEWSKKQVEAPSKCFLMGGLHYIFEDSGIPRKIENVIYKLTPGKELEPIYTKRLLPNYDIFDEEKYFSAGEKTQIFTFNGQNIGLLICEDMWASSCHEHDPIADFIGEMNKSNKTLDLIVNLSASPYNLGKEEKRVARAMEISQKCQAPFAYVNRVGGEDEILFDGASFVINADEILAQGPAFTESIIESHLPESLPGENVQGQKYAENPKNTWEGLFDPIFSTEKFPPALPELVHDKCQSLVAALTFGIQEYAQKTGLQNFLVALSGGADSALVTALVKLSLQNGQDLECLYMPGKFSADISLKLSQEMCDKIQVPLNILPIDHFHEEIKKSFVKVFDSPMEGLTDENIQSRLRGALLYARSNQTNRLVLNTSNKSELGVGYSTQYGDSVGAISVLGDLYKTEVFALCRYINQQYDNMIPQKIIERPPTAELREGQTDGQSLPPYERLDAILEGLLSYRPSLEDLVKMGFCPSEVKKVYRLYQKSEYKRKQFCPILKVKTKSFGFGYRVPITKK